MPHPENCICLNCQHWFLAMAPIPNGANQMKGRCHCGHPLDDHRMTSKGEVVACPGRQPLAA